MVSVFLQLPQLPYIPQWFCSCKTISINQKADNHLITQHSNIKIQLNEKKNSLHFKNQLHDANLADIASNNICVLPTLVMTRFAASKHFIKIQRLEKPPTHISYTKMTSDLHKSEASAWRSSPGGRLQDKPYISPLSNIIY